MRNGNVLALIGLAFLTVTAAAQTTNYYPSTGQVSLGNANINSQGTWAYYSNGSYLTVGTATTNGIAISEWGQVGIGGNPTEMFDVLLNTATTGFGPVTRFYVPNDSSGNTFTNMLIGQLATGQMFIDTNYNQSNTKGSTVLQPWGGNVGIGTTNPGVPLEVNGNVKLTANSGASITFQDGTTQTTAYTGTTCGGDYAESVDVTGGRTKYEPGDVLVLDADNPGKMLKSIQAYSTSVSGIYSTKPGTVGRHQTTPKSLDEVPMAVVGIVPAKVSTENGPINVGDLLVTSSTPGYAMKGTDRSRMLGAVVGKAMAKLNSGTGVIEVLVTLQ